MIPVYATIAMILCCVVYFALLCLMTYSTRVDMSIAIDAHLQALDISVKIEELRLVRMELI